MGAVIVFFYFVIVLGRAFIGSLVLSVDFFLLWQYKATIGLHFRSVLILIDTPSSKAQLVASAAGRRVGYWNQRYSSRLLPLPAFLRDRTPGTCPGFPQPHLAVSGSLVPDCRATTDVFFPFAVSDATQLASAATLQDDSKKLPVRSPDEAKRQCVSMKGPSSLEGFTGVRLRLKKLKRDRPSDASPFSYVSEDFSE